MNLTINLEGVQEGEQYTLEVCVRRGTASKTTTSTTRKKKETTAPVKKKGPDLDDMVTDELAELNKNFVKSKMKVESSINL